MRGLTNRERTTVGTVPSQSFAGRRETTCGGGISATGFTVSHFKMSPQPSRPTATATPSVCGRKAGPPPAKRLRSPTAHLMASIFSSKIFVNEGMYIVQTGCCCTPNGLQYSVNVTSCTLGSVCEPHPPRLHGLLAQFSGQIFRCIYDGERLDFYSFRSKS